MTTITINRATVEQALEALDHEIDTRRCKASTLRAMISLRAALAQQDEPAREWVSMDEYKRLQGLVTSQGIRLMEYESKQPQQAEPVKPVAWRVQRSDGQYELYFVKASAERAAECYIKRPQVEPLYTAPPQRKLELTKATVL